MVTYIKGYGIPGNNNDYRQELRTRLTNEVQTIGDIPRHADLKIVNSLCDLLSDFDGNGDNFENWERQLNLLISNNDLSNNVANVLISKKLKGKAFTWFHSKPEHIEIISSDLIIALRKMFYRRNLNLGNYLKIVLAKRMKILANKCMVK